MSMDVRGSGLPFRRLSYARSTRVERISWRVCVSRTKNGKETTTTLTLDRARRQLAKPPQWRIVDGFISPE